MNYCTRYEKLFLQIFFAGAAVLALKGKSAPLNGAPALSAGDREAVVYRDADERFGDLRAGLSSNQAA